VRHRFDQLGKKIGLGALGPSGTTVAHDEISPDAYHADLRHEPDPAREAERARLGLLGQLAAILCLIEIYSGAPDEDEVLACVGKLIAFRQRLARNARKDQKKRKNGKKNGRARQGAPFIKPFVWIVTAGRSVAVLTEGGFSATPGWPPGVYFSPGLYRVGLVVASELPRERATLLVRLMAAGPLLAQAIEDLSALPEDAHERAVASEILLGLQHVLGSKHRRTPDEEEFIVSMQSMAEKLVEQGRIEGRDEGRDEGRLLEAREALRRVLTARKLIPGPADDARIETCADLAMLHRWFDQAMAATTISEALAEGAGARAGARRRRAARSS
jgi:hypothetical protein